MLLCSPCGEVFRTLYKGLLLHQVFNFIYTDSRFPACSQEIVSATPLIALDVRVALSLLSRTCSGGRLCPLAAPHYSLTRALLSGTTFSRLILHFCFPILESPMSLRAVILLIENGIYIHGVYKPSWLPKWQWYWCDAAPRSSQWRELGNLQAYGCGRACTGIYIYVYLCIGQWIDPPITYLCIYLFYTYVEAVLACLPDGDVCLSIVQ